MKAMNSFQDRILFEHISPRQSRRGGIRASLADERGATLVEAALVSTVLFLLLFGIIEFGIVVLSYNSVSSAAREGARYGAVDPAPAEIEAAARAMTGGLDPTRLEVDVTLSGGETPRVTVQVRYRVDLITGLIIAAVGGDPSINLQSTSSMHLEYMD